MEDHGSMLYPRTAEETSSAEVGPCLFQDVLPYLGITGALPQHLFEKKYPIRQTKISLCAQFSLSCLQFLFLFFFFSFLHIVMFCVADNLSTTVELVYV